MIVVQRATWAVLLLLGGALCSACLGDLSLLGAPCDSNDDCGQYICKIEEGKIKGVCAFDDGSGGTPEPLDRANGDGTNGAGTDAGPNGGGSADAGPSDDPCADAVGQFNNPDGDSGGPVIQITSAEYSTLYQGNCTAQSIGNHAYQVFFTYSDAQGDVNDTPQAPFFEYATPTEAPSTRSALIEIESGHTASGGSYIYTVCVEAEAAAIAGRFKDGSDNWSAVDCVEIQE
jgi:hypothetical protein